MPTNKKGDERLTLNEDNISCQGFSKPGLVRPKRALQTHQALIEKPHGGICSANSDNWEEPNDKKVFKANPKKGTTMANRIRPVKPCNKAPVPPTQNPLNKYRNQIRKFVQSIDEYRKLENSLKATHENLVTMRREILESTDVEPGEVPEIETSVQDLLQGLGIESKQVVDEQPRLQQMEQECCEIKEAFNAIEEEKKKLEETLEVLNVKLKSKEEELIKIKETERQPVIPLSGEGDIEDDVLSEGILKLDQESGDFTEKVKKIEHKASSDGTNDQKIRSLEILIENLHVEIKKLKDQLKMEKESKKNLEMESEKLMTEITNLKSLTTSSDSKYIILEKDQKIQDLQKRLNEISRIRPHGSTECNLEVFKVDFSADTPSLVTQLAKFVQLYEDVAREGFDLESKLKYAHVEIYRLEQILEKQLLRIKEQDECLKNMEESLNKVVVESRKNSRSDQVGRQSSKCKCDEFEVIIREKEEFSEKLKDKMSLLYQKYKQYKSECNLMKKKLDAFEKRSWLKKLVNI